jgi:hypothetical protein
MQENRQGLKRGTEVKNAENGLGSRDFNIFRVDLIKD